MVIVDGERAVISSSNLTATAGYTYRPEQQDWTNYEAGIVAGPEDGQLVCDAEEMFERIWADSEALNEDVVGAVIGQPGTMEFQFVLLRGVRRTQYVVADAQDGLLLGKVEDINTLNISFPELDQPAQPQRTPGARRRPLPELRTLFSGESKEQAFLTTTTFYDPQAAFSTASVRVLKQQRENRFRMPLTPTAPGAVVRRASDEMLRELQGGGQIQIGTVLNHEHVPVMLNAEELVQKHCAVYGMTGAGKSNGLKVLLKELVPWTTAQGIRIVVVDTHGEYDRAAQAISSAYEQFEVTLPDTVNILDEVALRDDLHLRSVDGGLKETLWSFVSYLEDNGEAVDSERLIAGLRKTAVKAGSAGDRLMRAYERTPEHFVCEAQPPLIRNLNSQSGASAQSSDLPALLAEPRLYVMNLRGVHDARARSATVGWVIERTFQEAKASHGGFRVLFVVDEVQNFAPESGLDDVRPSLEAMLRIAREGRKFGVGLLVSSQRPANVNTDLRSQCNSYLLFRMVNWNDLRAIEDSVDAADRSLVESLLPQLDTGTCFACGTAIQNPFFAEVPLFGAS